MAPTLLFGYVRIEGKLTSKFRFYQSYLNLLSVNDYVAIKIYERDSEQALREVRICRHIDSMTTAHIGSQLVRTSLDDFEVERPLGKNVCIVHTPLAMSLANLRAKIPSRTFDESLIKSSLYHLLLALDFLHTEARIIHAGQYDRALRSDLVRLRYLS